MTVRNLDALFRPRSVALVGASERDGALGRLLLENLRSGGFAGPIRAVNAHHDRLLGAPCYRDVAALPETPDLAVIATPPDGVPDIVAALAARGTRAAVVITAGFSGDGAALRERLLAAARPALLRVVGPNCLGVLAPHAGLNASFAHLAPRPGGIAFVAQSGAMITSILDWAASRGIGFSALASIGDMADVDFGDLLDYLADDRDTRAILLYVEAVTAARKFMSAARAAARSKPVIVVKAGRHAAAARAAASHTGALAGRDAVYDAAFRRAGMLRVDTLEELFDAAETLALVRPPRGERLVIVTNGGGIGVLATDALAGRGGRLAELSQATLARLDAVLPPTWSHANPVDIIGDAPPARYRAAMQAVLAEPAADAILVLNCPTAVTAGEAAAAAVIEALPARGAPPVFTSWVGGSGTEAARSRFRAHGIPTYESPEDAVTAFQHLVEYRRNQAALLETPPSLPEVFSPDLPAARAALAAALAAGREWLSEIEAKQVLAAYGIAVVETRFAADAATAGAVARGLGVAVALKIVSPDLTHKSDVGGVVLDLAPDAVQAAAEAMRERIAASQPTARIEGFAVEAMVARGQGVELIAGVVDDHQFGPVILFGHGGTAVELIDDTVIALPPLNLSLARAAIARTRVARLLGGYRGVPALDIEGVALTLVRLSQLVVDLAEVVELDINPLLARVDGVTALDARVRVRPASGTGAARLAIRPYPGELEQVLRLADGRSLLLRPIRPEDEPALVRTFSRLSPEEVRFRFFAPLKFLDHLMAARFTQIDYDRQMALVLTEQAAMVGEIHAVVRLIEDPDGERAEFAIVVERELAGQGLGTRLMQVIIDYARARGVDVLWGEVLADNHRMLALCRELGFHEAAHPDEPGIVHVELDLGGPSRPAASASGDHP
ncbi:MAG: bifunctional acetate--CoA ligase family protein/GNAT family N-acetyltransferase [Gammaproteobacteria bacterium]|nr:bifunctional acetate--CoA ligase family protein/GNAT family N-acetyltransferase [Gammaproteobacteria bacterium]